MAVDVTVETTIESPPEAVAAYAGDPTSAPEWYESIRSVEWQTPPPVTVGSRMDFVAQERAMRRDTTKDLLRLKTIVESRDVR